MWQNKLPPNMLLWHDYFELKKLEKPQVQKEYSNLSFFPQNGR